EVSDPGDVPFGWSLVFFGAGGLDVAAGFGGGFFPGWGSEFVGRAGAGAGDDLCLLDEEPVDGHCSRSNRSCFVPEVGSPRSRARACSSVWVLSCSGVMASAGVPVTGVYWGLASGQCGSGWTVTVPNTL